jgi:hypothetical protein
LSGSRAGAGITRRHGWRSTLQAIDLQCLPTVPVSPGGAGSPWWRAVWAQISGTRPALLFRNLADALDGIAPPGTEWLKKRCRGTLELLHGVVQPVARHGSAVR